MSTERVKIVNSTPYNAEEDVPISTSIDIEFSHTVSEEEITGEDGSGEGTLNIFLGDIATGTPCEYYIVSSSGYNATVKTNNFFPYEQLVTVELDLLRYTSQFDMWYTESKNGTFNYATDTTYTPTEKLWSYDFSGGSIIGDTGFVIGESETGYDRICYLTFDSPSWKVVCVKGEDGTVAWTSDAIPSICRTGALPGWTGNDHENFGSYYGLFYYNGSIHYVRLTCMESIDTLEGEEYSQDIITVNHVEFNVNTGVMSGPYSATSFKCETGEELQRTWQSWGHYHNTEYPWVPTGDEGPNDIPVVSLGEYSGEESTVDSSVFHKGILDLGDGYESMSYLGSYGLLNTTTDDFMVGGHDYTPTMDENGNIVFVYGVRCSNFSNGTEPDVLYIETYSLTEASSHTGIIPSGIHKGEYYHETITMGESWSKYLTSLKDNNGSAGIALIVPCKYSLTEHAITNGVISYPETGFTEGINGSLLYGSYCVPGNSIATLRKKYDGTFTYAERVCTDVETPTHGVHVTYGPDPLNGAYIWHGYYGGSWSQDDNLEAADDYSLIIINSDLELETESDPDIESNENYIVAVSDNMVRIGNGEETDDIYVDGEKTYDCEGKMVIDYVQTYLNGDIPVEIIYGTVDGNYGFHSIPLSGSDNEWFLSDEDGGIDTMLITSGDRIFQATTELDGVKYSMINKVNGALSSLPDGTKDYIGYLTGNYLYAYDTSSLDCYD